MLSLLHHRSWMILESSHRRCIFFSFLPFLLFIFCVLSFQEHNCHDFPVIEFYLVGSFASSALSLADSFVPLRCEMSFFFSFGFPLHLDLIPQRSSGWFLCVFYAIESENERPTRKTYPTRSLAHSWLMKGEAIKFASFTAFGKFDLIVGLWKMGFLLGRRGMEGPIKAQ